MFPFYHLIYIEQVHLLTTKGQNVDLLTVSQFYPDIKTAIKQIYF